MKHTNIELRNNFLHVREIKTSGMTEGGIALPDSLIKGTGMYEILQANDTHELNVGDVVVFRHQPVVRLSDDSMLVEAEFLAAILDPDIAITES